MSKATVNVAESYMREIGPLSKRKPQLDFDLKLPPGTKVVSCDTHWEVNEDVFYEKFPAHLKSKAPRVWFDHYWHIGYKGTIEAFPLGQHGEVMFPLLFSEGLYNLKRRLQDMDAECIDYEICFPQTLFGFVRYPDPEVQENMYRVYNSDVIRPLYDKSGGRTIGVGIFANWWDPEAAERSMRQIVDLGLKTFLIPVTPGPGPDGKPASWGDPHFDRFWSVVAEAKIPVSFHVAEGLDMAHRGGGGLTSLCIFGPLRKPWGQLVFGGVFDRNPSLQVVFVEAGVSWVPSMLQDAEMIYDCYYGVPSYTDEIKHRPSHYWHNNCYGVFQNDRIGLKQLDILGADRIMWASDYPHSEGTFGYGRSALQTIVDTVSPDDARAIIGGNAIRLFKLEA